MMASLWLTGFGSLLGDELTVLKALPQRKPSKWITLFRQCTNCRPPIRLLGKQAQRPFEFKMQQRDTESIVELGKTLCVSLPLCLHFLPRSLAAPACLIANPDH